MKLIACLAVLSVIFAFWSNALTDSMVWQMPRDHPVLEQPRYRHLHRGRQMTFAGGLCVHPPQSASARLRRSTFLESPLQRARDYRPRLALDRCPHYQVSACCFTPLALWEACSARVCRHATSSAMRKVLARLRAIARSSAILFTKTHCLLKRRKQA